MTEERIPKSHWNGGMRGDVPPYDFHIWVKGEKKPRLVWGSDPDHIRRIYEDLKIVKIRKLKTKKDEEPTEPLGPPGALLQGDPDYKGAYEVLRDYIDSTGGPPENLRKRVRELWIDYQKPSKK